MATKQSTQTDTPDTLESQLAQAQSTITALERLAGQLEGFSPEDAAIMAESLAAKRDQAQATIAKLDAELVEATTAGNLSILDEPLTLALDACIESLPDKRTTHMVLASAFYAEDGTVTVNRWFRPIVSRIAGTTGTRRTSGPTVSEWGEFKRGQPVVIESGPGHVGEIFGGLTKAYGAIHPLTSAGKPAAGSHEQVLAWFKENGYVVRPQG